MKRFPLLFVVAGFLLIAAPVSAENLAQADSASAASADAVGVAQSSINAGNALAGVGTVTGGDIVFSTSSVGAANIPTPLVQVNTPNAFSQPYKPDAFVNDKKFNVTSMTYPKAQECADASVAWAGGDYDASQSIILFYDVANAPIQIKGDLSNFLGSVVAQEEDASWVSVLCEAALTAMSHGATHGLVSSTVRGVNDASGFGIGLSSGAAGLVKSAASGHPYGVAVSPSFGIGSSNIRVEGDVVLELLAFRETAVQKSEVEAKKHVNGRYGVSFEDEPDSFARVMD